MNLTYLAATVVLSGGHTFPSVGNLLNVEQRPFVSFAEASGASEVKIFRSASSPVKLQGLGELIAAADAKIDSLALQYRNEPEVLRVVLLKRIQESGERIDEWMRLNSHLL